MTVALLRFAARIAGAALVVSMVTFLFVGVGADPAAQVRQNPEFTPADVERIIAENGWDRPLHERYLQWLRGFVTATGARAWCRDDRSSTSSPSACHSRCCWASPRS